MPDYRAYVVGKDGRFRDVETIDADNDEDALEAAEKLVDGHDVELWQRDRKIAVFRRTTDEAP